MKVKTLRMRLVTVVLVCVMLITTMASSGITASAASWRTGKFSIYGTTSGITVRLSNTSKNAKVKIHTYGDCGWPTKHKERGCDLYVAMRRPNGSWIWGGNIYTGSWGRTMTLGCDNSVYVLTLQHPQNIHCWDFGHCCPDEWAVECTSNCYIG